MGMFDGWTPADFALTAATGGTYGLANAGYKAAGGDGSLASKGMEGAGKVLGDIKEARQSNFKAHPWYDNPNYNPDAFQYGGFQGGSNYYTQQAFDEQGREQAIDDYYRQQAEQAQNRQINEDPVLAAQEAQSRQQMGNATDLARQAAEGNAPSAAQYMMKQGFNDAAAQQNAQAAGARGSAGIALAQSNANANIANLQGQQANAAGRLRAEEMANARGLYGQLAGAQEGANQGRLNSQFQNQLANRSSNDQYSLGLGGLAGQRSGTAQGYFGQGLGVQGAQSQAQQNQQQLLANNDAATQGANQQTNMFNTQQAGQMQQQLIGMFGSTASAGLMGGK